MITFKQFITEVFDKPLQWEASKVVKNKKRGYDRHIFTFDNEGVAYKVTISVENENTEYDISLYANGSSKFTGQNTPFKVYATLINIVDTFFKKNRLKSGDTVYMISADPKTGPIYKRFAREFAKNHNGRVEDISDRSYKVTIK